MGKDREEHPYVDWQRVYAFRDYYEQPKRARWRDDLLMSLLVDAFQAGYKDGQKAAHKKTRDDRPAQENPPKT